jgi:hypothetical protein
VHQLVVKDPVFSGFYTETETGFKLVSDTSINPKPLLPVVVASETIAP